MAIAADGPTEATITPPFRQKPQDIPPPATSLTYIGRFGQVESMLLDHILYPFRTWASICRIWAWIKDAQRMIATSPDISTLVEVLAATERASGMEAMVPNCTNRSLRAFGAELHK
jgi:hypothetical protein